jgi:hypothetical protein
MLRLLCYYSLADTSASANVVEASPQRDKQPTSQQYKRLAPLPATLAPAILLFGHVIERMWGVFLGQKPKGQNYSQLSSSWGGGA